MKIIFELRHPAHFHHFRFLMSRLREKGHEIKILISSKDILEDLLQLEGYVYTTIGRNKSGLFRKVAEILAQDRRIYREIKKFNPDLVIGRPSHPLVFSSFLLRKKRIIFAEDDFHVIFLNAIMAYPFAPFILAPLETDLGWFRKRKIPYAGYQKLAYLHPNVFTPDRRLIEEYIDTGAPFFLLRLSKLKATHDINIQGLSDELCRKLISILTTRGKVYISSERELPDDLAEFRLKLPHNLIHHAIYYADLFLGDSQSMAFESALLGTPALRFNSLGNKLKVLLDLEDKYHLLYNIHSSEQERLITVLEELLARQNLQEDFKIKRNVLLQSKIDVSGFMLWFVEQFPDSLSVMRKNPDFQFSFR